MSGMEFNKIFAALLVAGIIASLSGFIARETVHPHKLHENAVKIEGVEDAGAGGVTGPTEPEPILAMIAAADPARGKELSRACAACHNFEKGGPNGTGPNLWGVIGRAKGSHEGFDYSAGMKAKGGSWTYADLNHFLWKPKAFVDGTKMNFIGLKKPEDRAAMVAWLRTLSDSPKGMPSDSEIAAEAAELAPPAEMTPVAAEGAATEAAPAGEHH